MKKLNIFVLAVAMLVISAAPSFAMLRKDLQSVKGTVVSVNAARTEITLRDGVSGKDVTFTHSGISAGIMTGSPVIVIYKKGTTTATMVRLVAKKGAATTAAPMSYQAPKTTMAPATTTTTPAAKSKYGW